MNLIFQTLFNPVSAFNELKRENKFPGMTLVILLLLSAVNLILMVPITSKVMSITMSSMPLPEAQLDATMAMMHKLRYLMVLGGVFSYAVMLFIYPLIFYIITVVAKPAVSYMKSFTLIVYSYFALLIGEFVNTGILFMRGLDKITSPFEVMFTGLNVFTKLEDVGAGIYMLLCLINPFQIWFVILLSIGLKVFADIKFLKASLICIIFWLILLIYPVASAIFSEITMNKVGLM
jgi:Yip1 domain.